jgi:hypothetical protein
VEMLVMFGSETVSIPVFLNAKDKYMRVRKLFFQLLVML